MPKIALDKVIIEVICSACGAGQSRAVGYFRDHLCLTCDGCGNEISMENKQFSASIVELGRAMARLREPNLH